MNQVIHNYRTLAALTVAAIIFATQQIPATAQNNKRAKGLLLGGFVNNCQAFCGVNSLVSCGIVHLPQKGFVVQMVVENGATCFAQVLNLNSVPAYLNGRILFDLTGPTDSFTVGIQWTPPDSNQSTTQIFSVGNGIQKGPGNSYFIADPTIPTGSRINGMAFSVSTQCQPGTETVNLSNLFIGKSFVGYDLNAESCFSSN